MNSKFKKFFELLLKLQPTKLLAVVLSVFLFSFLLSYALVGQQKNSYALSKINYINLPIENISYAIAKPDACNTLSDCYHVLIRAKEFAVAEKSTKYLDLSSASASKNSFVLLRFHLNVDADTIQKGEANLMLGLPEIFFLRSDIHWKKRIQTYSYNEVRMALPIEKSEITSNSTTVDVMTEIKPSDMRAIVNLEDRVFITPDRDYVRYFNQVNMIRLGQGAQIGMITRVVLAALMLLFFVILDNSTSALGLALLMGFEATGMCFGNESLQHQWITSNDFWYVIKLSLYTISDFVGLYFMLNIAGHRKLNVWPWLGTGALVGVTYGLAMLYGRSENPIISEFWILRQLGTIGVGTAFCLFALKKHMLSKDYWRSFAIIFAVLGMSVVIVEAIGGIFPAFEESPSISIVMSLGKGIKAYLLTLSGLAGIASARAELALFEIEKEKSKKMSHELQLGREMQESLLLVPQLPAGLEISTSHVPAAYVSGDTYFFDWNPKREVFTVLLNDVPGHGLQAALKAYACNVIAKTVWSQKNLDIDSRERRSLFPTYQETVVEMLKHQNDTMPFNAFLGVEFFYRDKCASMALG